MKVSLYLAFLISLSVEFVVETNENLYARKYGRSLLIGYKFIIENSFHVTHSIHFCVCVTTQIIKHTMMIVTRLSYGRRFLLWLT
jgi:hypothetical protein